MCRSSWRKKNQELREKAETKTTEAKSSQKKAEIKTAETKSTETKDKSENCKEYAEAVSEGY